MKTGLEAAAEKAGIPVVVQHVVSLLTLFFIVQPVTDYTSALRSDTSRYSRFSCGTLEQGVYFPPSQFEAAFLSLAHSEEDIEETILHAKEVMKTL